MTIAVQHGRRISTGVDYVEYDGRPATAREIVEWITGAGGTAFEARELAWRHDSGSYWHKEHGFVYLPAAMAGSRLGRLRDDELVIRTAGGPFAVAFPGDFVLRSRSGFYPLASESFHRYYVPARHRGTADPGISPPP